jgi:hypothetical protein
MAEHPKFQLGQVASVTSGNGFSIQNQHGSPLLSFVYRTAADAQAARAQIEAALVNAIAVTTPGP